MTDPSPPTPPAADHLAVNRDLWDGWTRLHHDSRFCDLEGFRAGASSLNSIELDAVGDVSGRELLHLQCHFGMDTLSWARRGARATGVDFSPTAVERARDLADELGLDADFHCGSVLSLPEGWTRRFDIVFTSYGVLTWLPDLGPWAREIARVLKPTGVFHLVEFHPLAAMLDDEGRTLCHPYFHDAAPVEYQVEGSYADPGATFSHAAYEWSYGLPEIHAALVGAGLVVDALREYPFSPYGCFPYLEEVEPDRWKVRGAVVDLPLVFSLRAIPGDSTR